MNATSRQRVLLLIGMLAFGAAVEVRAEKNHSFFAAIYVSPPADSGYGLEAPRLPPSQTAPAFAGPSLSTALPVSGVFQQGLVTTRPAKTGTTPGIGIYVLPVVVKRKTFHRPLSFYVRPPMISGRTVSRVAAYRAIYAGLP